MYEEFAKRFCATLSELMEPEYFELMRLQGRKWDLQDKKQQQRQSAAYNQAGSDSELDAEIEQLIKEVAHLELQHATAKAAKETTDKLLEQLKNEIVMSENDIDQQFA